MWNLSKVNNKGTNTMCYNIYSKLEMKTLEWSVKFVQGQQERHWTVREICSKLAIKTLKQCVQFLYSNQKKY